MNIAKYCKAAGFSEEKIRTLIKAHRLINRVAPGCVSFESLARLIPVSAVKVAPDDMSHDDFKQSNGGE